MLGLNLIKALVKHNVFITITCVRLVYSGNEVRVRFAPSPTGFLHLGGLRTALYNFLFARSHGGKFILRIEDTDQTRLVPGALKQLQEDLEWVGIVPDEGPIAGGDYGPYMQSKRTARYKSAAENLIANGAAYRCFCSEHRLELLRKDALRRRQVPRYDNRCRNMTQDEIEKKLHSNKEHCVRLKLIPGCDTFTDIVYGNITHNVVASEGDPVILKSDGFPTYHLANVVDDHQMKISHVLRGVEWQSSTPKHLILYKGFGWTPPQFAHLPLLLNSDGTKLSKRQGDISIKHYRSDDISPQALINFVTFSGGGFHRDNSDTVRSLDLEQLVSEFDLRRVDVASCRVSLERLDDFNHIELVRQMANETELCTLISKCRALILAEYSNRLESLQLEDKYIRSILLWSLESRRITRLGQLAQPQLSYLWIRPTVTPLHQTQAEIVSIVYKKLQATEDFTQKPLSALLRSVAKTNNVKIRDLMHLLRLLLCGLEEGPAVAEMLEKLGRQTSLARLRDSLDASKN